MFKSRILPHLMAACAAGITMFGFPRLVPAEVSLAEAVDFPGFAPELHGLGAWRGQEGLGQDGIDAVASSVIPYNNYYSAWMKFPNPLTNSGVNGSFWWYREAGIGLVTFASEPVAGGYQVTGAVPQETGQWESLRFHYDQGPSKVSWEVDRASGGPKDEIPAGKLKLDQFTWEAAFVDSFKRALDSDAPEAGQIGLFGWNAVGEALVEVKADAGFVDGDALEVRADSRSANAVSSGMQTTKLTAMIGAGDELVFRARRSSNAAATLTASVAGASDMNGSGSSYSFPLPPVTLTTEWTEIRLPIQATIPGYRELRLQITVPRNDPTAFVSLDAVSLKSHYDINAALETNGLAWTVGGEGAFVTATDYFQTFVGLRPSLVRTGDSVWVETTFTGPGTVVFGGSVEMYYGNGFDARLLVDGQMHDQRMIPAGPYYGAGAFWSGPFGLQARLPAGAHTVRWQITALDRPETVGYMELRSCAFIPETPVPPLETVLGKFFHEQTWQSGGTLSVQLLHQVEEGVTSVRGIRLPPAPAGGTPAWLETTVRGPADVSFFWNSGAPAYCSVDGVRAAGLPTFLTPYTPTVPPTVLHLPPGWHTLRWEAGNAPADLWDFSVSRGSPIGEFLTTSTLPTRPPIVWVSQSSTLPVSRPWDISMDPDLWDYNTHELIVGGSQPVMGGADRTYGKFRATGPATLYLEMRQGYFEHVFVQVGDSRHDLLRHLDNLWHPQAVTIPPGEHEITVAADYDDLGSINYVWLRSFLLIPDGSYKAWTGARGLALVDSSPAGDADLDGQSNLMEFAFGSDPKSSSDFMMPSVSAGAERRLQLPALPYDATGLMYEVETSLDLESWTTVATASPNAANEPGPVLTLPPPVDVREFVRVRVRF